MDSAIWGLIGTIVGALTSIGTAWLAAHSTSTREQAKLSSERSERGHAFQRQTLIDLQDAIHAAIRFVHQAHVHDKVASSKGCEWGKIMQPAELAEDLRVANQRVAILTERVADDALRGQVHELMEAATYVLLARSEEESTNNIQRLGSSATQVLKGIGAVLRSHY